MTIKEKTIQKEMKTIGGSSDPADFDNNIGIYNGKLPTLWKAMEYVYTDPKNAISVVGSVVTAKIKKPKQGQPIEFWMRREVTTTSTSSTASTTSSTVSTVSSTISTTTVSSTISTTTVTVPGPTSCPDCANKYLVRFYDLAGECCAYSCSNMNTTFELVRPWGGWPLCMWGYYEITHLQLSMGFDPSDNLWHAGFGYSECECSYWTHAPDGTGCPPIGVWPDRHHQGEWGCDDVGTFEVLGPVATTTAPGGGEGE